MRDQRFQDRGVTRASSRELIKVKLARYAPSTDLASAFNVRASANGVVENSLAISARYATVSSS